MSPFSEYFPAQRVFLHRSVVTELHFKRATVWCVAESDRMFGPTTGWQLLWRDPRRKNGINPQTTSCPAQSVRGTQSRQQNKRRSTAPETNSLLQRGANRLGARERFTTTKTKKMQKFKGPASWIYFQIFAIIQQQMLKWIQNTEINKNDFSNY